MKEDSQKTFKKLTLFFLSKVIKNKRDNDQSLFRLQNKFRKISLLVIYYLTKSDDIILSNFPVISNIAPANLCKPIHDINYSTSLFPFESGKFENEGKKL